MKKYASTRYYLSALAVAFCLIFAVVSISKAKKSNVAAASETANESTASPGLSSSYQTSGNLPLTDAELADLMDRSKVIVVGTVRSNICRLDRDKENVETHYTVQVNEVLNGMVRQKSLVSVTMPGGLVMLKHDGSEVTEKNKLSELKESIRVEGGDKVEWAGGSTPSKFTPPEGRPLVNGKSYVLFLSENPDAKQSFVLTELTGSSQSAYEVEDVNAPSPLVERIRQERSRPAAQ